MDYLSLIRPDLKDITPYVSAASLSQGATTAITLDANENPWPPFGKVGEICATNRYPTFEEIDLYRRVAQVLNVEPSQFYMGRGSSEAIDLLIRLFCRAGQDELLVCPPTFSMYEITGKVQGAKTISVPLLENGQLDLPSIKASCTDNTKLIFIPTPNAPMGHTMNSDDLLELCRTRENNSIIVADEAYIELTDTPTGLLSVLKDYPNLVILRTLSKAYGLAGERIGMAIAATELINLIRRIAAPYVMTQSSIKAAMDALSPTGLSLYTQRVNIIKQERDRLTNLLPQSPMIERVFDSVTNFFLVQSNDLEGMVAALTRFGIRARPNVCAIPNTIRLSIGSPEENTILLEALDVIDIEKKTSSRTAQVTRDTNETKINVLVNLDEALSPKIDTSIGFFDHMLCQIAQHGGFGLTLTCDGDLKVDQHHSIEDCALALGEAIKKALGDKKGIERFGFTAPLDEALATVTLDLSGRPHSEFNGKLPASMAGEFDTEMVPHFFQSFAMALGAGLHVSVKGDNTHHMIEASFKALGRALRQAIKQNSDAIPSTKGCL